MRTGTKSVSFRCSACVVLLAAVQFVRPFLAGTDNTPRVAGPSDLVRTHAREEVGGKAGQTWRFHHARKCRQSSGCDRFARSRGVAGLGAFDIATFIARDFRQHPFADCGARLLHRHVILRRIRVSMLDKQP